MAFAVCVPFNHRKRLVHLPYVSISFTQDVRSRMVFRNVIVHSLNFSRIPCQKMKQMKKLAFFIFYFIIIIFFNVTLLHNIFLFVIIQTSFVPIFTQTQNWDCTILYIFNILTKCKKYVIGEKFSMSKFAGLKRKAKKNSI